MGPANPSTRVRGEARDLSGDLQWLELGLSQRPPGIPPDSPGIRARIVGGELRLSGPMDALRALFEEGAPELLSCLEALERREFLLPGRRGGSLLVGPARPRIMGILNLTPDSFSDGGSHASVEAAVEAGLRLLAEGADILDLGAESSRPGSAPVSAEEEGRRLLPVLEALRPRTEALLSIDTTKAVVARAALELGADWINDISALRKDPGMAGLVAEAGAAVVLMHMKGVPKTMQEAPSYRDPVGEVLQMLGERLRFAMEAGISKERILLDPGIGFGKRPQDNLDLLQGLSSLRTLGCPVLLGASRKRFLGHLRGEEEEAPAGERDLATAAVTAFAHARGVSVHRVHSVRYATEILGSLMRLQAR